MSVFGHQMRFDLADGFPLLTTKKLLSSRSSTNCSGSCTATPTSDICRTTASRIWDEWADANGDLGPVYGQQWRSWPAPDGRSIDQIANVVDRSSAIRIRAVSSSRAWNPAEVDKMALPPCHCLFQFYVAERQAVVPALSALRRRLPRRALQHRLLRAADDDGGAGHGLEARRLRAYASATPISIRTTWSRRGCSSRARRARCR